MLIQMAYELHGVLAGDVSMITGEKVVPAYRGVSHETFLEKVVTPIYKVIEKVIFLFDGVLGST